MNQKKLGDTLGGVVEDCVNKVGVDLNTASASLLEYISGITKVIARNLISFFNSALASVTLFWGAVGKITFVSSTFKKRK